MKFTAALLALLAALSAGCNTMEGLGKDLERGGEKLQNEADRQR